MNSDFYTGYRRNIIAPEEVLVAITIPCMSESEQFIAFKQVAKKSVLKTPKLMNRSMSNLIYFNYHIYKTILL